MEKITVTEVSTTNDVKIVVVGVGGGGSNMVNYLQESEIADQVKLAVVNTDAQALESSKVPNKLQIGKRVTAGKGAGMDPKVGKDAALESYNDIKDLLKM